VTAGFNAVNDPLMMPGTWCTTKLLMFTGQAWILVMKIP